ncbi:hypothetical protein SLEP1_g34139 [Rubroshorea leprosula]|uniref:Uncharacterized protein n=1 Tax=Rubroshorea leprosula TaxID=152421 RepID=A0AAV5KIX6_9ROSI|nr:hypothetical protein SLEP1_g34139 [Rubroshorea leprosula]
MWGFGGWALWGWVGPGGPEGFEGYGEGEFEARRRVERGKDLGGNGIEGCFDSCWRW